MTVDEQEHIAIIVCDTIIDGFYEKYGDFGDTTAELFNLNGNKYPIVKYQVIDKLELPSLDAIKAGKIKAITLTGSRSDAFDNEPWMLKLLEFLTQLETISPQLPLSGFCFGHQIIARNLGFTVGRNADGWETGLTTIKLNEDLAQEEALKPLFSDSKTININEMHQDIVYPNEKLLKSSDLSIVGSSDICGVQGLFCNKSRKLITFQGHPEFTNECEQYLIDESVEKGRLTESSYKTQSKKLQAIPHDGDKIAQVFLGMIEKV